MKMDVTYNEGTILTVTKKDHGIPQKT